ncbi:MAG TPA: cobyrinate a,c-diamide synthase, partial [Mycobacterium sp.]|nr:cobyrinate a,c-diamide synthase [Mycobacterium sp.]
RFTPRLTLGYRDAVAVADSSLYRAGERVVGHEFHRTTVEFSADRQPAWVFGRAGAPPVHDGAISAAVHASYLHTHAAAQPRSVARFVSHAAALTKLAR